MLLQRTSLRLQFLREKTAADQQARKAVDSQRPLTCMFYFFASQLKNNMQPADPDLVRRGGLEYRPTHQLGSMIARLDPHTKSSP